MRTEPEIEEVFNYIDSIELSLNMIVTKEASE
jgi:hypothetical protein